LLTLDKTDITILNLLQSNGRMKRNQLAEETGLSLPAVSERMRKLEARGIISGYRAVLDAKKIGRDILAFVQVKIDSSRHYDDLMRHVEEEPEILECHAVTGEGSHLLKILTTDTAGLEKILSKIQRWKGVTGTITSVVLSTIKETTSIPLTDKS